MPKYCMRHRSTKNRARTLRVISKTDGPLAAEQAAEIMGAGQLPYSDASSAWAPMLLAGALGLSEDVGRAAELVRIAGTTDELAALANLAETEHKNLVEGDQAGLARLTERCLVLSVIQAMRTLPQANRLPSRPDLQGRHADLPASDGRSRSAIQRHRLDDPRSGGPPEMSSRRMEIQSGWQAFLGHQAEFYNFESKSRVTVECHFGGWGTGKSESAARKFLKTMRSKPVDFCLRTKKHQAPSRRDGPH